MSVLFFSKKCQGAYQKIIFHFHIFHFYTNKIKCICILADIKKHVL